MFSPLVNVHIIMERDPLFVMGKSTISMAISNRKLSVHLMRGNLHHLPQFGYVAEKNDGLRVANCTMYSSCVSPKDW